MSRKQGEQQGVMGLRKAFLKQVIAEGIVCQWKGINRGRKLRTWEREGEEEGPEKA